MGTTANAVDVASAAAEVAAVGISENRTEADCDIGNRKGDVDAGAGNVVTMAVVESEVMAEVFEIGGELELADGLDLELSCGFAFLGDVGVSIDDSPSATMAADGAKSSGLPKATMSFLPRSKGGYAVY